MKSFILLPIFLLLTILTFAQSDSIQFQHFDKGKNIIGLQLSSNSGASMILGGFSLRYGRFWMKQLNAGLESGFAFNGQYSQSYYFKPFGRYYILNKKISPFLEISYSYRVTSTNSVINENLKEIENAIFTLGGLAYTGILKRFGIEFYGGYYYAASHYLNHPTDNANHNENDYIVGARINFHF